MQSVPFAACAGVLGVYQHEDDLERSTSCQTDRGYLSTRVKRQSAFPSATARKSMVSHPNDQEKRLVNGSCGRLYLGLALAWCATRAQADYFPLSERD